MRKREGRGHPDIGMYLLQLAKIFEASGDIDKAEKFYAAPFMCVQASGPDHSDTGSEINILAGMYDRKAEYAKSEPLYLRTLKIFEQSPGSNKIWLIRQPN